MNNAAYYCFFDPVSETLGIVLNATPSGWTERVFARGGRAPMHGQIKCERIGPWPPMCEEREWARISDSEFLARLVRLGPQWRQAADEAQVLLERIRTSSAS